MAASLQRTFNPKLARYSPDGHGRDRYIAFDNGGLLPGSLPRLTMRKQMVFNGFPQSRGGKTDATVFTYVSDGSGRDYYITVNSGGLHPTYQPGGVRDAFRASLRSDGRRTYVNPQDYFTRTNQGWLSPSGRQLQTRKKRVLSEVTSRLYTPRLSAVCSRASSPGERR